MLQTKKKGRVGDVGEAVSRCVCICLMCACVPHRSPLLTAQRAELESTLPPLL